MTVAVVVPPQGKSEIRVARTHNSHARHVEVNKDVWCEMKRQKACVLWFTGPSAGQLAVS